MKSFIKTEIQHTIIFALALYTIMLILSMLYLRKTADTLKYEANQITTQGNKIGDVAVCKYKISKAQADGRNGYKTSFYITFLATIVYITISPMRYSRIKKSAE